MLSSSVMGAIVEQIEDRRLVRAISRFCAVGVALQYRSGPAVIQRESVSSDASERDDSADFCTNKKPTYGRAKPRTSQTDLRTSRGSRGQGRDLNFIAEVLKSGDEALGLRRFGTAVEMIWSEVMISGAILEHVVDGGED
jgi:hypothetical protein